MAGDMVYLQCPECEGKKQITQQAYDDMEDYPTCPKCDCDYEEEEEVTCNICQNDISPSRAGTLTFTEEDTDEEVFICRECLAQILKKAKVSVQTETKIVEKIVEKPVEKIVYKTIDKNGNEIGINTSKTKFD